MQQDLDQKRHHLAAKQEAQDEANKLRGQPLKSMGSRPRAQGSFLGLRVRGVYGCFHKFGVLFVGVLSVRALLFLVYARAPNFGNQLSWPKLR